MTEFKQMKASFTQAGVRSVDDQLSNDQTNALINQMIEKKCYVDNNDDFHAQGHILVVSLNPKQHAEGLENALRQKFQDECVIPIVGVLNQLDISETRGESGKLSSMHYIAERLAISGVRAPS